MFKRTSFLVFALCVYFTFLSFNHPIKLTSSLIKYSANDKNLRIECKVFIDDFAPALSNTLEQKINDLALNKEDLLLIENYFKSKYKIFKNSKKQQLYLKKYKVKDNVMTLSILIDNINFKKGDHLKIENELLFEKFPDLQSNWMTLQIPPFLSNYSFESNFENYFYSHTF